MSTYDTIIIGAGMSGLAAGIRLAHYDRRVCILERHYTIGGLNSFYRMRGRDYDVGLHAVTNFTPKGTKKGPLARLLRQLRFRWDDFQLAPQIGSRIQFPNTSLAFGNDIDILRAEIGREFPQERDNFERLLGRLLDYDELDQEAYETSARAVLDDLIGTPLLREMLLCPLMWYGNARERDMDFGQFCIMFRSIFLEGFARPFAGVRLILKNLVRRFRSLGGELRLRSGVEKIAVEDGHVQGVVLDNGDELNGNNVLSSAGWVETMRMCDDVSEPGDSTAGGIGRGDSAGQLSFTESVSILDTQPKKIGHTNTIVFYNDSEHFHWEKPADEFCDLRTGVVCSPNNFSYAPDDGELPDGVIRITSLANHAMWNELTEDEYRLQKLKWFDRVNDATVGFVPDFRSRVIDYDMFTPTTIRRFTWHDNGAVYGAPDKHIDGRTHLDNLFVCGTDQGFVGIVGAIVSGISITNQYLLRD
jgi:phytoene dehydrogenase-like protein